MQWILHNAIVKKPGRIYASGGKARGLWKRLPPLQKGEQGDGFGLSSLNSRTTVAALKQPTVPPPHPGLS